MNKKLAAQLTIGILTLHLYLFWILLPQWQGHMVDSFSYHHASIIWGIMDGGVLQNSNIEKNIPFFPILVGSIAKIIGVSADQSLWLPLWPGIWLVVACYALRQLRPNASAGLLLLGSLVFLMAFARPYYYSWPHGIGVIQLLLFIGLVGSHQRSWLAGRHLFAIVLIYGSISQYSYMANLWALGLMVSLLMLRITGPVVHGIKTRTLISFILISTVALSVLSDQYGDAFANSSPEFESSAIEINGGARTAVDYSFEPEIPLALSILSILSMGGIALGLLIKLTWTLIPNRSKVKNNLVVVAAIVGIPVFDLVIYSQLGNVFLRAIVFVSVLGFFSINTIIWQKRSMKLSSEVTLLIMVALVGSSAIWSVAPSVASTNSLEFDKIDTGVAWPQEYFPVGATTLMGHQAQGRSLYMSGGDQVLEIAWFNETNYAGLVEAMDIEHFQYATVNSDLARQRIIGNNWALYTPLGNYYDSLGDRNMDRIYMNGRITSMRVN